MSDESFLDCGDNSCRFAPKKGGMRTNGGCRCLSDLDHDPDQRMRVTRTLLALCKVADAAAAIIYGDGLWAELDAALKEAGR